MKNFMNIIYNKRILIVLLLLVSFNSISQTYTLSSNLGTITTCAGTFVDEGGIGANYSNNSNYSVTFCSGSSANIKIDFTTFDLEFGDDFMAFYDGSSNLAPSLGISSGNIGANTIQSSGSCLTIEFTSDGSVKKAGWVGTISCVIPCSPPTAAGISSNQPSPIKLCVGETVNFDGSSSYAALGFTVANYLWSFDDGNTSSGVTTSHTFSAPGEYIVQLDVTDNNGCHNTNNIDLVVQVGTVPNFVGTTISQTICQSQNLCLDGVVNPTPWVDVPVAAVAGTISLPDGSGVCYDGSLIFNEFNPTQTITSASQVNSIVANLEHSWAGDLTITIICPNGQNVGLFNADGTWNTPNISLENFGNPTTTTGYDYTWTNSGATMDTWVGLNSSANTIPAGTYASEESFSGLVGCPLNGTWIFRVCDMHSVDDGTVFSWGINFDPSLFASLSSFTPVFNTNCSLTSWTGTNPASSAAITSTSSDCNQICITPSANGSYTYLYSRTDDFGCTFDTTITITVNQGPSITNSPLIQSICSGGTASIVPTSDMVGSSFSWTASLTSGNVTGFVANGTGNISNILTNTSSSPGTVTYTITPTGPAPNFCVGLPVNYVVTVNPTPTITNASLTQAICSGSSATFIPSSGVSGATFAWSASLSSGTVTGFSASGSGNISEVLSNSTSSPGIVTYFVTPTGPATSSCPGNSVNFVVTVNPKPVITNVPLTQTLCSGSTATFVPTSSVASSSFSWSASLTSGSISGFSAGGSGNISDVLTNSSSNSGVVSYVITPTGPATTSCVGTPVNYIVTVNPTPTVTNTQLNQVICSGASATFTPTSGVLSSTFAWTGSNTSGTVSGFSTNGSGNISEVLTNVASSNGTVTYEVSPTGPSPTFCLGSPVNFVVTINQPGNPSFTFADYCQGSVNGPIISGDLGGTFTFNPSVTDGATINATSGVIQNGVGGTQYNVQYSVACSANTSVNVLVNPIPNVPVVLGEPSSSLCTNTPLIVLTVSATGNYTWIDNSNSVLSSTSSFSPPIIVGIQQYEVYESLLGCKGPSTIVAIEYEKCEINIPTAITPDENNIDDVWELKDIDVIYPNNVVSIYNRWGALLYKSDKGAYLNRPWDGKYNNEYLPVASYFFIIEYNEDKIENSSGTVSIIKK